MDVTEKSPVKFNKDILMRFGPSVDNGTVFLYNADSDEYWTGNQDAFKILKLIDGKTTLKEIYSKLALLYEISEDEIKQGSLFMINELIEKNYLKAL